MIQVSMEESQRMKSIVYPFSPSRRQLSLIGALVLLGCCLLPVSRASAAVEPNAAWFMTAQGIAHLEPGAPSSIEPPPAFEFRARNVGAAPTEGEWTFRAQLPNGFTLPDPKKFP